MKLETNPHATVSLMVEFGVAIPPLSEKGTFISELCDRTLFVISAELAS